MQKNPVILLIFATMLEAEPFVKGYDMELIESKPFTVYQGRDKLLIITGIGKANSAMATAYSCIKYSPSVACNIGAAGAVVSTMPLGSIYHIEKIFEFDRPGLMNGKPQKCSPDLINGFNMAILATQDRPVIKREDRQEISGTASLVDMEGASVAQTCRVFGIKCLLFKFVSDTPDDNTSHDIIKNIFQYRQGMLDFFASTILPAISNDSNLSGVQQ